MNEQKVKEQIELLNEDVSDRIENMRAIRGDNYVAFVTITMNLFHAQRAAVTMAQKGYAATVHDVVSHNCTRALETLADLFGFTDSEVEEALAMSESITDSIDINMQRVLKDD